MYLPFGASKIRQREAQNARNNRADIVKALSQGQITKRDLIRWGIFTAGGLLVAKNGLSPFARSAVAAGPTGTPRSPLREVRKVLRRMRYIQARKFVPAVKDPNPRSALRYVSCTRSSASFASCVSQRA